MNRTVTRANTMPVIRIWTGRDRAKIGLNWRIGSSS